MAKKRNAVDDFLIDFSKEEQGAGGSIRLKPGQYHVKIVDAKPTRSEKKGTMGLELKLKFLDGKPAGKTMVERLWATPKAYSRFRTLLEAVGAEVPKRINLSDIADDIKGETLFVELDDEEREGYRTRSRVTFEGFISEDDADDSEDDDDEDVDEEDDEDEEEEPPAKKRKSKKSKKDEDDLDLDDY